MRLAEMYYTEIEIEGMKEILRDKEKEIKKLNERIRFLEQCLDNREKVNKSMREELSQYKEYNSNLMKEVKLCYKSQYEKNQN